MKLFNSFAAAVIALAFIPAVGHAEKVVTKTTHTHTESVKKYHGINLSNVYVAGQVGYNNPNGDILSENAVYAGQIGYRFNPNFRAEVEGAYRKNTVDVPVATGRTRLTNTMLNGWYDFANSSKFTPYVGGGAGWSFAEGIVNVGGATVSDHDNAFVYQAGAGVAYNLCKDLDLTVDYRYINTNSFNYIANEVRGGVRYNF